MQRNVNGPNNTPSQVARIMRRMGGPPLKPVTPSRFSSPGGSLAGSDTPSVPRAMGAPTVPSSAYPQCRLRVDKRPGHPSPMKMQNDSVELANDLPQAEVVHLDATPQRLQSSMQRTPEIPKPEKPKPEKPAEDEPVPMTSTVANALRRFCSSHGYSVVPSIEEIEEMSDAELKDVRNFKIKRVDDESGVAFVTFDSVDLTEVLGVSNNGTVRHEMTSLISMNGKEMALDLYPEGDLPEAKIGLRRDMSVCMRGNKNVQSCMKEDELVEKFSGALNSAYSKFWNIKDVKLDKVAGSVSWRMEV